MARGGKRDGAGRPRKSDKHAGQIAASEQRIADRLPQLVETMMRLATGGQEIVEEKWAPKITTKQEEHTLPSGDKVMRNVRVTEMVLVERKVSKAAPDRAALQYCVDRIMGKPTERHEIDSTEELDVTSAAMSAAAKELAEWRKQQTEELSNLRNAPPT